MEQNRTISSPIPKTTQSTLETCGTAGSKTSLELEAITAAGGTGPGTGSTMTSGVASRVVATGSDAEHDGAPEGGSMGCCEGRLGVDIDLGADLDLGSKDSGDGRLGADGSSAGLSPGGSTGLRVGKDDSSEGSTLDE